MTNIPYTYLIKFIPTGQCYYGVRYSKNYTPDDLWVTYFTSSRFVKKLITEYGKNSFTYEVRRTFTSATQARRWEEKVLRRLNAAKRDIFINKYDHMHFDMVSRVWVNNGIISKFVDFVCLADYLQEGWVHGRLFSNKHKSNISTSKQGRYTGALNPMYGKKHTEQTKNKLRTSRKGKIYGPVKLTTDKATSIINAYAARESIDIPHNKRGKQLSYDGAFSRKYAEIYNVTPAAIMNIIKRKTQAAKNTQS